jgi:amino acid adenylation domain-containing protein
LGQFRGPRISHFTETSLPRLFEEQAAKAVAKVAVTCAGQELTYGELNARANQLARHLRARGVGRETLVGICVDRSLDMAVGILGILKSGGAYLPLDPDYPEERLAFMLNDARPSIVVTKSDLKKSLLQEFIKSYSPLTLGEGPGERACSTTHPHDDPLSRGEGAASGIVLLDQDWARISQNAEANLSNIALPNDLAYVIYTSGSTGEPKGAMIEHANLANYLLALNHELGISSDDNYLHTASLAFSSSRRQLMLPLSQGATVVIATSDERKDPLALLRMIKERGVTVMDAVPSFWRTCTSTLEGMDDEARRDLLDNRLHLMLSASEPLSSDIPRTWMTSFGHPARHVHMFGQTETAGIVCLYNIPSALEDEVSRMPVGRPIANSELYILDQDQRPCAVDVAGELYIGGAGVGRGYLNRPELTAEKFIPHPFSDEGGRLYRTGDWARHRADGQIEFAGRRDQQVKLRGFRVELGEVETALAKHPLISECAVVAREDVRAGTRLIAYFVSNSSADARLSAGDLRSFLSARLPEHAIPSAFAQMDALPLSPNGKVNRLALPEAESARPLLSSEYVMPRTPDEHKLAAIWSEVLQLERVGINDNFFELGGHSLLAAQVAARIRAEFKLETSLRWLFESPTVALMVGGLNAARAISDSSPIQTIVPSARTGSAPLSFTQQQFWLLAQAEPDSCYNICTALKISGPLQIHMLEQALNMIVERHEILRTNVVSDWSAGILAAVREHPARNSQINNLRYNSVINGSGPVQVIALSMRVPFEVLDLRHLSASQFETEIQRLVRSDSESQFDLSAGPLVRLKVLKAGDDEHVLLVTVHHLVCDGWSVGVLLQELVTLYRDACAGRSPSLPELRIQYADYAIWQRERLQGPWFDRQLDYWRKQMAGAAPVLDLPTDYARPERYSLKGAQESVLLPVDLSQAIGRLSREEGATLFMTLLAAFQTLLFRYSGQEDIVVGSPVAGRSMLETEELIGSFVNTLALRADLSGKPSFREFLGRVRTVTLAAFSNQDVPFEKLVEELNPERKSNRTPLFQVMFALQNTPVGDMAIEGLTLTPLKVPDNKAKFDLTLEAEEEADGLRLCFEYNSELFRPETISRMLGHFRNLLEAIAADPALCVTELPLLTDSEQHQLLNQWNGDRVEFPESSCIHTLFEAQAERTPEAIAVEFQGESLTYHQLNQRANQLAHALRSRGVGPDSLVGICVHRSFEMLVGMLGVLKAGGAYVPLDPANPADRIAFMIQDAGLSLVLTQERLAGDIPVGGATLLCLDRDWPAIANESDSNPTLNAGPTDLAYVIYTSGSTGNPKGVMIEHRSLVNFTVTSAAAYEIGPADRVLQFASLSFDLSVEEIYPALMRGATIVLRTDEMISSARDFMHYCEAWRITILDLPTAYWHELTDALNDVQLTLPKAVRLVIIGGEKAAFDRVVAWHKRVDKGVRLVNTYGPTETTVAVTMCDLKPAESLRQNSVPIGRPLANATAYLLDESLRPVPIGAPGELYIGGPGVARGYVKRPELTAEKFIQDPFSPDREGRLYRTGDLVRYRADGNIEFLGRIDNQIKIRGFRIELEEIEQALRTQPGVADCVVALHEESEGDKRLFAYVVASANHELTVADLRNYLKTRLPSYMIPAAFELIDALPLLPSGKINRRALPAPRFERSDNEESFVAPRTPIERLLAVEWCDVLKLERIGIHDNFFELGGHSLLAAKVVSRVRGSLEVNFGMVDLFQAPTIASLAALLFPRGAEHEPEDELAALLGELAGLTDEEAQVRFDHEIRISQATVA